MRPTISEAIGLLRSGGPGNLDTALGLIQKTVFAFSMKMCGQREDAEDTAQEVLFKAIPYLEKFEDPKALSTWLYTVVKNRCLMSRRKSKFAPKEELSLDHLMPDSGELDRLQAVAAAGPTPEKSVLIGEDTERLKQAILTLPPQYRIVLVLHDVEELSTEQVAGILGLSEANVRVRLHRARLFVRKEMAKAPESSGAQPTPAVDASAKPARSRSCKQIFANLSEYLDGVLDDSLCQELERHMAGCKPCEAFLASLQQTVEQTHKLPDDVPDAAMAAKARESVVRRSHKTDIVTQ